MSETVATRTFSRRAARVALQWLAPLAIIATFIATGHLGDALSALSEVSLVWSVPLVLAGIALPVSHAWRWCYLLQRTGESLTVAPAARITALASLLNYAAPGFLGAPAKAIFARDRHGVPISRSLPTLGMEQVLDAAMLALFGSLAVLLTGPILLDSVPSSISVDGMLWVSGAAMILLLIGVAGWFLARSLLPGFTTSLSATTVDLIGSRVNMKPILGLTATRWVLDMFAVGVASIAVGLRLSLVEILLIANVSLLAGLVAPVPGGLGVREGVMAAIAGAIGISIPAILLLSVLHRAGLALGLPIVLLASHVGGKETR